MPAPIQTPRSSWIAEGLRALGIGGPDAVRIENLAQTLGVSKGGFYWHFEGRAALLEEMLDSWERVVTDEVISRVEADGGDARSRLRHLFTIATSIDDMLTVELAIREWGRRDEDVAKRLRRLDNRRMDYMRSLFGALSDDPGDVEARCFLAFSIFIASNYIAAEHPGSVHRADVLSAATERLLA
jgi:AcrR family transcriptional regulator